MRVVAAAGFRGPGSTRRSAAGKAIRRVPGTLAAKFSHRHRFLIATSAIFVFILLSVPALHGREHKKKTATRDYGLGFSTEISAPESEVVEAVEAIVNDGIIQGSKEYNKDKYIENASAAASSPLFPEWKQPGKVYYKVREGVLAPVNFKDSKDQGTVAVRYVVQSKDAAKTILRIDAVFVEDFHRTVHPSSGSVENAECQDVQDHIESVEAEQRQTEERDKQQRERTAKEAQERKRQADEASVLASAEVSGQTPDQHLNDLRRQAERIVKAPGVQLKSAPFRSASNVKSLEAGAEVVIVVVTPYWYGVETTDGQHGWINRSQLERLP
ncbi:MAG: hypothetical protein ACRD20_08680 [Terriglobales bacterium]